MSISVEDYRSLVQRLEGEAERAPGLYRFKVGALAVAGFAVLGGAGLLALGMSVGLVGTLIAIKPSLLLTLAKLVWLPVALGWTLLASLYRALAQKFEPPQGYRLADDAAPALQAEVERLRVAAGAPPLQAIIIDDDLNAAASSAPRALGLLGHRHYLLLGLPLMQSLDREQFCSVIAHEFGHFGGGHGRFGGWIYRVRNSWYRVLDALHQDRSWATRLFAKFFDWYAPYFNAYSFVLARKQEYEADATAARIVGKRASAQALVRVNIASAHLDTEFWPGMQRSSNLQPEPPQSIMGDMKRELRSAHERDDDRLSAALAREPGFHDTHPTLAQRLEALGEPAQVAPPPPRSFAEELLGDLLPKLEQHFSEQWRQHVEESWGHNFRQHAQDVARFAELDAQPQRGAEVAIEYADLFEKLRPEEDPLQTWLEALASLEQAQIEGVARANARVGSLLLDKGDAAGVTHLRRAQALDADFTEAVLQRLHAHYERADDKAALARVESEQKAWQTAREKNDSARNALTAKDGLFPHGLDETAVEQLRATLANSGVGKAWLVRKRLPGGDHGTPHFVLLVTWHWRSVVLDASSRLRKLVDGLQLPGTFIAFVPEGRGAIAKRVRKAAGKPIYRR